jgi:large-conductance mechanosensitive channel
MAFVYATIFGFDYVILAFLIFLLIISIAKNFAKKSRKNTTLLNTAETAETESQGSPTPLPLNKSKWK